MIEPSNFIKFLAPLVNFGAPLKKSIGGPWPPWPPWPPCQAAIVSGTEWIAIDKKVNMNENEMKK